MGESAFLADVRLYLGTLPDVFVIRINTGVFRPLHGPQDRRIRSAPNGTPDLLGRCLWVPLAIETKSAKGPQRQAQIDFEREWSKGGIYVLARTMADIDAGLEQCRVISSATSPK